MKADEIEKEKILSTKSPSFTLKMLRPVSNLLAQFTSPSQVRSILRDFGFEGDINTPYEAEAALVETFETLTDEKNETDIKNILEEFLTLYTRLVDEKFHYREDTLVFKVREILRHEHITLAYNIVKKRYLVMPFEGPVHGIVMRAEGTTEEDFEDRQRRKARTLKSVPAASAMEADSKGQLRAIHLVTSSVALGKHEPIFMVLDEQYEFPIRFDSKNQDGTDTCVKKLRDIAHFIDVAGNRVSYVGQRVPYDRNTADNINNGLFKRKAVSEHIRTNGLRKPTLVQKSEKGLVLKNDVPVKNILIKDVPKPYRALYMDKSG